MFIDRVDVVEHKTDLQVSKDMSNRYIIAFSNRKVIRNKQTQACSIGIVMRGVFFLSSFVCCKYFCWFVSY